MSTEGKDAGLGASRVDAVLAQQPGADSVYKQVHLNGSAKDVAKAVAGQVRVATDRLRHAVGQDAVDVFVGLLEGGRLDVTGALGGRLSMAELPGLLAHVAATSADAVTILPAGQQ